MLATQRTLPFLVASSLLTASARGEPDPSRGEDTRRETARAVALQGDAEFYAGRCDRALTRWEEAERTYHAPTLLVRIARCRAQLGRLVAAVEALEAALGEELRPDAPAAFVTARDQAKRDLAALRPRLGTLQVVVHAASDRGRVVIEIDGSPRPGLLGAFPVDPGEHEVRVRAGGSTWQTTIKVHEGERASCDVALWAAPEPAGMRVRRGVGVAALGAGGAAIVVGLGLALGARGAPLHEADRARTLGTAGDATLAVGAGLALAGALLVASTPARRDVWQVLLSPSARVEPQ